jgi:hypothetical protein
VRDQCGIVLALPQDLRERLQKTRRSRRPHNVENFNIMKTDIYDAFFQGNPFVMPQRARGGWVRNCGLCRILAGIGADEIADP